MVLDTRSLVFVNAVVFMTLGLAMVFLRRTRKTYPGFGLWVLGTFIIALGQLLLGLRGLIPDYLSIVISNLLVSTYYVLIYEGMRRFIGGGSPWISSIFSTGLVLAFLYFTYIDDNISKRIIVVSLFNALISIFVCRELLKSSFWKLRSVYWFNSCLFLFNFILMILRAIMISTQPEIMDVFATIPILTIGSLLSISLSILWTFGIIFLTIDRLEQELKNAQTELQRLSIRDSLTGTYNHRYFFEIGKNEVQQARRYHLPLAVIVLDIDEFKLINDSYGHSQGNEVLIGFVSVCHKCLREVDILGRLGGDEFGVILTNTNLAQGKIIAERLCKTIADSLFPAAEKTINITASIGLSLISEGDEGIEPAFQRADKALYEAKNNGRNAVAVFPQEFTETNQANNTTLSG